MVPWTMENPSTLRMNIEKERKSRRENFSKGLSSGQWLREPNLKICFIS